MSRSALLFSLSCLALLSLGIALTVGSVTSGVADVVRSLVGQEDPILRELVLQLRMPRALAAFGTGACLAVAGALMQVLLRNPLADPYILGTSGGAAVAALVAMLLGLGATLLNLAAFAGALTSTLAVFALARSGGNGAPGRLLLTGVVVAAGWSAMVSLLLAIAPERNLRGMMFWLMGDFAFAESPVTPLLMAAVTAVVGLALAPSLNVLATGDRQALALGLAVRPLRIVLYFLSSLLTAVAVTTAGTVGFVGLVIPHLIRIIGGSDHRTVIPCSILAGGSLLVVSDTLARTVIAPRQLPVGAITAMVGVPLFLILLHRSRNTEE